MIQILAELYQAGGETLVSVINKLINSIWNKEELPDQWKEPVIVQIHKKGDKTHTKFYPLFFSEVHVEMKLLEIISMGFDITGQLLIIFLHSSDTGERKR
jgi:hypothetical protein